MATRSVSPTIVAIECRLVRVPVIEEWAASPEFGGQPIGPEKLILKLTDSDGVEGWGEGLARGEGFEDVVPRILGKRIDELRVQFVDLWSAGSQYWQLPVPPSQYTPPLDNLIHRLRHPMQPLVEMALLDLIARRAGVPVSTLWGGRWRDAIVCDYWVGRATPEMAARAAKRGKKLGFHGLKIKTTLEDPNVERLEAIKDAAGEDFKVTVDPNSRFYRFDDALKTILAMDAVGNMGILEDPFPRHFLDDYKLLRPRISARLVVHIDPPESLWTVISSGAVGGLNIDSHTQGMCGWRSEAAAAEHANLPVWHGSSLDLGIATAAQLQLCASAPNCQLPGDQVGPWIRESHLLKSDFGVEKGCIRVPDGPGMGVEVDPAKLDKYTARAKQFKR